MSSLTERRSHKRVNLSTLTNATCAPAPAEPALTRPAEVVIGRIVDVGADGAPIVDFPENPTGHPILALATARYDPGSAGPDVALMFVAGDLTRPLVIGIVRHPNHADVPSQCTAASEPNKPPECVTFSATKEIVFQCGRASIVLTQAGKLLLRGAYLSLHSTGMHRISGASVHIN
jgi:hypothetical protein